MIQDTHLAELQNFRMRRKVPRRERFVEIVRRQCVAGELDSEDAFEGFLESFDDAELS